MSTDEMSNRHTNEQNKCRIDKISNRQNVDNQNVDSQNDDRYNIEQTKCRTDKMPT